MENLNTTSEILLSVIVAIVSDTTDRSYDPSHLDGCLQSLAKQRDVPPLEIIIPYPAQVTELQALATKYAEVKFLPVTDLNSYKAEGSSREHHDELRSRGISAAKGDIIALIEDYARVDADWCRSVVEAHRQDYAAIGGAIENEIDRPLNWAVYYCDFGKYQNPVFEGESPIASDANISYKRSALQDIQPVWEGYFHEREVNWALQSRGQKIALSPKVILYQHRKDLALGNALKERFIWGRSYAATRVNQAGSAQRLFYILLAPLIPFVLLARIIGTARKKGGRIRHFVKVLPLTALLLVFWSVGELAGYLTKRPG